MVGSEMETRLGGESGRKTDRGARTDIEQETKYLAPQLRFFQKITFLSAGRYEPDKL